MEYRKGVVEEREPGTTPWSEHNLDHLVLWTHTAVDSIDINVLDEPLRSSFCAGTKGTGWEGSALVHFGGHEAAVARFSALSHPRHVYCTRYGPLRRHSRPGECVLAKNFLV